MAGPRDPWTGLEGLPTIPGMPTCQRCGETTPSGPGSASPAAPRWRHLRPGARSAKRVSVLFCDLVGCQPRRAARRRGCARAAQLVLRPPSHRPGALRRHRGEVHRRCGDGVVRRPERPRGRPGRAVRAALSIHQAIAAFNEADPTLDLHVRIGVTTGEALVAPDASPRGHGLWRRGQHRGPAAGGGGRRHPGRRDHLAGDRAGDAGQPRRSPPTKIDPVPAWQVVAPRRPRRRRRRRAGDPGRPGVSSTCCAVRSIVPAPPEPRRSSPWSASGDRQVGSSGSCCSRSRPSQS